MYEWVGVESYLENTRLGKYKIVIQLFYIFAVVAWESAPFIEYLYLDDQ